MTVEHVRIIDAIGIENDTGNVVLTIADHLEWDDDSDEHLLLLQEKLNTYLAFVECGEILGSYPNAEGRHVVIEIVCKYEPDERALNFLSKVAAVIKGASTELRHKVFPGA